MIVERKGSDFCRALKRSQEEEEKIKLFKRKQIDSGISGIIFSLDLEIEAQARSLETSIFFLLYNCPS